ncbi:MAG: phosphoribosylformylglycinamidine synthase subunit PurQ [Candidatus Peregrinibacteria bacterium]
MEAPLIAVVSFPGNNCEVESRRAIKAAGMRVLSFKWNDPHECLKDVDGYFLVGGFAYEDRGRAGMVAARDPLFAFLHEEAARGKVIIGNCNGAQVLVESGLIPLDRGLRMSLARNVVDGEAVGFINEWVWITPTCRQDRCATSDWTGITCGEAPRTMHLPIAHGEGRFTTKDRDVWKALKANDQIAFSYCDAAGNVSDSPWVTPNGSTYAAAGICNPSGNVVALMPHPERTVHGLPYFESMRRWIESKRGLGLGLGLGTMRGETSSSLPGCGHGAEKNILSRMPRSAEIFIGTIITNNEERTVEQAVRRIIPKLALTQWKYVFPGTVRPEELLSKLSFFNPNKDTAVVRREGKFYYFDAPKKSLVTLDRSPLDHAIAFLRRDEPDTGAAALGFGAETGVCYVCRDCSEVEVMKSDVLEIFGNPHASTIEVFRY